MYYTPLKSYLSASSSLDHSAKWSRCCRRCVFLCIAFIACLYFSYLFIIIFLLSLSVICRCGTLLLAWFKTSTIRCPPGFHHDDHCHHHHLRHLHHHRHDHHLQLFTASHPFEQYDLKFRDKFGFEVIIDHPRHHWNHHWLHNTYHIWLVFDYWSSSSSLKIAPRTDIYSGLYYTSPEV